MFGRTNNLVRLLTFVCEKHFEGATGEIKEYNIAVQALGRPQDFDPQVDTIVRVTAHASPDDADALPLRDGGLYHAREDRLRESRPDEPVPLSFSPADKGNGKS